MDYSFLERLIGGKRIAMGEMTPRCDICKARTQKRGTAKLFLLPIYQDKDYTPSAEYYSKACRPITQVREIPVGQRACRMWTLVCPKCEARAVLVVDFLMVRGQEVTEKLVVCDYAPLAGLLNGTNTGISQTASTVTAFEHSEIIGNKRNL